MTIQAIPDSLPANQSVHLSGNTVALTQWSPSGVLMERRSDGVWLWRSTAGRGDHLEYKFSRGKWETEAVGADGQELSNYVLDVRNDTILTYRINAWRDLIQHPTILSPARMSRKAGKIELTDLWKFKPGDDSAYARPEYVDSGWTSLWPSFAAANGMPAGWNGIGWLRLTVTVDSSLFGMPLAILVREAGASEWYLNGRLQFRLGSLPSPNATEHAFEDRYPRIFTLDRMRTQVFAVRYACSNVALFHRRGLDGGFFAVLLDAGPTVHASLVNERFENSTQVLFLSVAMLIALLHLMLFFFDRTQTAAFMLAVLTGSVAFMAWLNYADLYIVVDRMQAMYNIIASSMIVPFMGIIGLLTGFAFTGMKPGKHLLFYLVPAVGVDIWILATQGKAAFDSWYSWLSFALIVIPSFEWLWLIGGVMNRRRYQGLRVRAPWVLVAGAAIFVAGVIYQLLFDVGFVRPFLPISTYFIGFLVFALTLSIHLSYVMADNARELTRKLRQVQELSAKTIEQERMAHEQEMQHRLIESDNLRKTKELEDARAVQVSMLPREVPPSPNLDIAVRMKTATEVGGDYYDFRQSPDAALVAACGDATGHGMRAGIMVATMKGLFNALSAEEKFPEFFERCTRVLRQMHLGNLYMALLLVKIQRNRLIVSNAGMPPVLLYRGAAAAVEEIVLKSMPLGAHERFPYEERTLELSVGDTVLLMSDGLTELFNGGNEMLEMPRLKEYFRQACSLPVENLLDDLINRAEQWRGDRPQADDITLVAIRMK